MFQARMFLVAAVLLCSILAPAQGFVESFEKAAELGDRKAASKAVKENGTHALRYGRDLAEGLAMGKEDLVIDRYLLLAEVYKKVYATDVIKKMGDFYKEKGSDCVPRARELISKFRGKIGIFNKARRGNEEASAEAIPYYTALATEVQEFGDMLTGADCFLVLTMLHQTKVGKKDLEALFAATKGFVACRRSWDYCRDKAWKDIRKLYNQFKKQKDDGEPLSLGPGGGTDFKGATLRYAKGSKWERVTGKYKPWTKWDGGVCQMTGNRPVLWRRTGINGLLGGGKGQGIGAIGGHIPKIQLLRTKVSQYGLDANGDDKPDTRVKLGGKPTLVEYPLTIDGIKTRGAMFFWVASNQEDLGGINFNLAPNPNNARVYYRGGTGLEFKFRGQKYWFIDENANGTFGDTLNVSFARYGSFSVGLSDSIVLPGARKPVPCSSFIRVQDDFYKCKISGMTLKVRKLRKDTTPTGILKMEYKGPRSCKPVHLVMAEVTAFVGALFDIAPFAKGVEVPAGKYRISTGLIKVGRGSRASSAAIGSGNAAVVDVKPGEVTIVKVGGPYTFDFKYQLGGSLTVDGMSVKILGRGGEAYMDIWNGVPEPRVYVRKAGKGRGRCVGQMKRPESGQELYDVYQAKQQQNRRFTILDAAFAPLDIRVNRPQGSIQVRLATTRHAFFGKIESDWK